MHCSRLSLSTPKPEEALPCGSKSTRRTFLPVSARHALKLTAVVVLPTPPFWLVMAIILPTMFTSLIKLNKNLYSSYIITQLSFFLINNFLSFVKLIAVL